MKNVLIAIADGTEELECVTCIDLLRRASATVTVASASQSLLITASRQVKIQADCLIDELPSSDWDLIILPGGMPGAENLSNNETLLGIINQQILADRWLAAICAAPAVVLGRHHLIKKANATCYPSYQQELATQVKEVKHDQVVVDGTLITSQGPGTALAFSLTLIELLFGHNKRNEIATQVIF